MYIFRFDFKKYESNLVTLKKCNTHLQYYKIDVSFSIKLQEIISNACEEFKTEREARGWNRAEREDRIALPGPAKKKIIDLLMVELYHPKSALKN